MTSGAFARLCGTTKETLRHYKEIGLLSPRYQGDNGYFYYDAEQFYDFYAISIFRETGTPLEEIRRCLGSPNIAEAAELLRQQQERLQKERRRLEQMEFVLERTIQNWKLCDSPNMTPAVAWFETEHLLALPVSQLEGMIDLEAGEDEMLMVVLENCKQICKDYGLQTDYQLGAIHLPEVSAGQETISHLYMRIKEQAECPYYMEKPAGKYLYLCCQGHWDISEGYEALNRSIAEGGFRPIGNLFACDLAGFILNGVEKNAVSMLCIRLAEP